MNYYPHHIGDFIRDTANLHDSQLAAYMRMIWAYYLSEKPFADAPEDIAFAVRSDEKTVQLLLRHYFVKQDDGWHQKRIDIEIENFKSKGEKRRDAANARWSNANALQNKSNSKKKHANQEPITNNQSITLVDSVDGPDDEIENRIPQTDAERDLGLHISLVATPKPPACPHDALIDLFGDNLPNLAQPRKSLWMAGKNAPALKARWDWVLTACHESGPRKGTRLATNAEEGLNWFSRFFAHIAKSDFLNGRSSEWACDLIWIVNKSNFEKIIQGSYDNKEKTA